MKGKHQKTPLKRAIGAILACTIMFTGLPPVDVELPEMGIHLNLFEKFHGVLFDKDGLNAKAYDTMSVDHFDLASTGTYNVTITNGIRTVTINNAEQLIEYSIAYNTFTGNNHDTDIVILSTTLGTVWDLVLSDHYKEGSNDCGDFQSIGNDNKPFRGKIQLNGTDTININLDKPFLGTVEQCAEICNLNLSRLAVETDNTPILANQIINTQSASAPLSVNLQLVRSTNDSEEKFVLQDYAGIIGTIAAGTEVSLTVTNNMFDNNPMAVKKEANVTSSGAVGLLCCTMGEKSSLTATINSGTNNSYSVTSSGSSAGGLVGTMANGSKLILDNAGLNSITQTVTGHTYAGGIVGEATGAYIGAVEPDQAIGSMNITSNFKAGGTTLNGTTAAGYLFGSYTNTATTVKEAIEADTENNIEAKPAVIVKDRTFKIDSTFRNVSLTFASNNAGGYFGVLNNNETGATVTFDGGLNSSTLSSIENDKTTDTTSRALVVNFGASKNTQGGVISKYSANDLTNTLYIKQTYVFNQTSNVEKYGGAIAVIDDSTAAAYVKIEDFYTRQKQGVNNKTSGGLIYDSGSQTNGKGSFIDVSGLIRVCGQLYGGLVYSMPKGVLRLAGTTKLSEITADKTESLIVRNRSNGLIYSNGSGNDDGTGSSWKLIRNTSSVDDVYTWGEVVRLKGGDGDAATTDDHDFDLTDNSVIDETNLAMGHYIQIPAITSSVVSSKQTTTITDLDDFMRVVLYIQHYTASGTTATGDALVFTTSGMPTSSSILAGDITLSGDADLRGTGITGLTRDNGENDKYTGTFNGNNKTITLAIGEAYGYKSNVLAANNNGNDGSTGRNYRHAFNGLFAKIGNGAVINNLTVDGKIYLGNNVASNIESGSDKGYHYTGGFGASIEAGTINFANATSSVEIYLYENTKFSFCGGFVSRIADSNVTLSFTDCTSNVDFYDNRKTNADYEVFFGGFVSMMTKDSKNVSINFNKSSTGCILSGSYTTATDSTKTTSNIQKAIKYGGLVAYCENNGKGTEVWNTRRININSLSINGLDIEAKVGPTSSDQQNFGCAALLGYEWYGADVTIADMSVGATEPCSIKIMDGSRTNVKMAGLCTIATGHWQVDKLNIQGLSVEGNESSFGMLINSAFRPKDDKGMPAMYLELTNMKEYKISSDSTKVSFSGITNGYDELALHSWNAYSTRDDIADNGASIISINTDANANKPTLIMDGTACNTYQNQSYFGKTTAHNPNARYYYNLYYLRSKFTAGTATNAEKLLLWSVYQYVYPNDSLRAYFNSTAPTSGNLDMSGLSYYPIDYTDNWTFTGDTTLKFYNNEIELGEKAGTGIDATTGTGGIVNDGKARTTSDTDSSHTQHYMMHCGLFRNYITKSKTFKTQNLTLEGSVGIYNGGSGFLISGTLGGANSAVNFKPEGSNGGKKTYTISLNGAYVTGATSASYAPLLINKVEKNTTIHLYGVKTTNTSPSPVGVYKSYATLQTKSDPSDPDWYGATSLIGQVGATNGTSTGIVLDFSKIVLDSRKPESVLSTDSETNTAANTALTTAYNSNYSIFKKATLLSSFIYNESCSGQYNYEYDEDWGTTLHQVTYGQEVTYTFDNNEDYPAVESSQQLHYLGDRNHWTNPLAANRSTYYDFSKSYFLPYVGEYETTLQNEQTLSATTHDYTYHELDVNLMVASLDVGCGTYNDPYVITEGAQFLALAKILKGETIDSKFRVNLPDGDYANLKAETGDRNLYWCTDNHIKFYPDNGTYKRVNETGNPTTSNTYTSAEVRRYLAGAYYQVTTDISLSTKFAGIGAGDTSNVGDFAFHGVIVGKRGELRKLDGTAGTETRYPHITNKSATPFIVASNGSVIKNVGIDVLDVNKSITQDSASSATFQYNAGCNSYGAVMGKIMGGDNVIDNVPVTFTNTTFTLGAGAQVVPVGGYVGVVVNGGLFFRNMTDDTGGISGLASSSSSTTLASGVSFGSDNSDILSSKNHLYINPIIGRVINGYAVTEGTYKPAEANVTMKNTVKNYSIADILTTDQVTIGTNSITADSAQDFFILSLIVNSGTGSTTSALSYDKATFKATHIGTYEDVGCKQTRKKLSTDSGDLTIVCDTALFATDYTELTDESATPYITVKYTSSSGNAQVLTDSGKSYAISMSSSPWTMPYGFRGIGGFNSSNSSYQLGVSSINSGGSAMIINLMSQYYTYEQTYDNYPTSASCGFGLFNTFVPTTNCTVEKLTLSGQTKVTAYSSASGSEVALTKDSSRDKYLNTGMLAGVKSNANAFSLDTMTVNPTGNGVYSLQNSGGLIGDVSGAGAVTVTGCTGTNLIVHSAGHSGGFFGKSGSPIRINASSGTSVITINSITQSNGTDSWTANSAGSVIGYDVDSIIKNVTVSPVSGGTGITLSTSKGGAGGIIGTSVPGVTTNAITDCAVNNLSVSGRRTGAVVGQYAPDTKTVNITNVSVNGQTGSDANAKVERSTDGDVGTIVGYVSKTNLTIENCSSKNYIIKSNAGSTGGCIGYVGESSTINLKNYLIDGCEFQSASQATGGIIGGLGGASSQVLGYNIAMNSITKTNKYAADFVGSYSNKTLKIVGFSRTNTPAPSTATDYSTVCSNAVCVKSTTQTELPSGSYIIFADYNGTGYDATGTPNTDNESQIKQRTNAGTEENPDYVYADMVTSFANAKKSPYVLINPYKAIDVNTKLTGDGIADTAANLAITDILSDLNSNTRPSNAYTYADAAFDSSHLSNLSTINTQLGSGTVNNDFAILVLEDTNHNNSQAMINGYLKLLTNTKFNYADNSTNSAIYSTQLYKMELEEEEQNNETVKKFVKTGDANLKIDANHRFYMMNDKEHVDTGLTTMFSLIDIQFYDPTDTSNSPAVAYHLYVPVLVKKMLKYNFYIATGSGTIYDKEWYDNPSGLEAADPNYANRPTRFGKILLENLGTPGTLYFTYSYERTLKEWQESLEYGENLLLNYDKVLTMKEVTAALDDMASDTMLTLVDLNQNDRSYYARFSGASGAWANDELCLYKSDAETPSVFKTSFGSGGVAFKPIALCDMLNISVTENATAGKFVKLDDETDAKVRVNGNYYRLFDSDVDKDDNAPSMRYDLTVINKKGIDEAPQSNLTPIELTESYYLSFFTKASNTPNDETINYYEITSPRQITGGAAAAKPVTIQGALILFGNLYQQTEMTVTANPYSGGADPQKLNPPLIDDNNDIVRTKLETTVSLTTTASNQGIATKLDDSVDIYQSFVVYLTKHKDNVDTKGVVGNPAATASYTITPVNESEDYRPTNPTGVQKNELNYVEAKTGVSIKNYLKNTGGATITAELVLTYDSIDQRNAQFPVDSATDNNPQNYTFVTATSNIAYDPNKTAYSKNLESGEDTNSMKYHIASGKVAALSYNAIADDKGNPYGQLGINANDLADSSGKVKVKTNAVYAVTDVAEEVPISTYPYVKVTFKLQQKQAWADTPTNSIPGYPTTLQIGQYLENVQVKGTGITTATPKKYQNGGYVAAGATDTEYVFILNRSQLKTNNDENILSIPIEFEVITGTAFERANHMYGNFRIELSAQCMQTADAEAGTANAKNYIVYTNAKLITQFIEDEAVSP